MPANETARFLGEPSGWGGARVELADLHGLWGGCRVGLAGDGTCVVTLVQQPPHRDGTYMRRLSAEEAQRVLAQCVAYDLVTIRFPTRTSVVPDETHPEISLINAAGERRTVGCWANDPKDPGFESITATLRAIAQGVDGEPAAPPGAG